MNIEKGKIEDILERLGNLVDQLENFIGFNTLPISDDMKIDGLHRQMKATRDEVKDIYFDLGGEDVWPLGNYDGEE